MENIDKAGEAIDERGPGVMVALQLPDFLSYRLALPGGEEPSRLHVTLAYLGRVNEIGGLEALDRLQQVVEQFASEAPALVGTVGGMGRFNATSSSDGKDVITAGVDLALLPAFRQLLVARLIAADLPPKMDHGYVPHITLAYVDPGADWPATSVPTMSVRFDQVSLVCGPTRMDIALGGVQKDEAGGSVHVDSTEWGGRRKPKLPPPVAALAKTDSTPSVSWERVLKFHKLDGEKRLVFGWLSVVADENGKLLVDSQQDVLEEGDLELAVYAYVIGSREAGDKHQRVTGIGKLVESCMFTTEKMAALGIPAGILPIGWWVGYFIEDDTVWEKIKSGEYKAFSIGGAGVRRKMA